MLHCAHVVSNNSVSPWKLTCVCRCVTSERKTVELKWSLHGYKPASMTNCKALFLSASWSNTLNISCPTQTVMLSQQWRSSSSVPPQFLLSSSSVPPQFLLLLSSSVVTSATLTELCEINVQDADRDAEWVDIVKHQIQCRCFKTVRALRRSNLSLTQRSSTPECSWFGNYQHSAYKFPQCERQCIPNESASIYLSDSRLTLLSPSRPAALLEQK